MNIGTQQQGGAQSASAAKKLGFSALCSIAIGLIVSQTSTVSLLQALGIGGAGFFAAYAFALMLSVCNAMSFAELALSLPKAGSISTYAEVTVGHFPAILAVFAGYVVPAIFGLSAELILFDSVITQLVPVALPTGSWALLLLGILLALNMAGTDVFATTQQVLTFVIIAFFLVVGVYVISGTYASAIPTAQVMKSFGSHAAAAPVIVLCFWTLIGCEYVTPMVEEARNARKDLPRAMIFGLVAISAVNLVFAYGAAHVLPRDALTASMTPHLDVVATLFGHAGRIVFAVIALTASASLINAVLGTVPRMLHGMALNGQVFPVFKRVSARRQVPVAALLFVAACPVVGLVWARGDANNILPLTIAATICWMLVYMLAHVVLLVLRARRPGLERPFRTPLYPLPQVVAIAGLAYVICNSSPDPAMTGTIFLYSGSVITLFGGVAALWVKFVMKQPLFAAVPVSMELVGQRVTAS